LAKTTKKEFILPSGETKEEITNFLLKYIDSIVEFDENSKLIAKNITITDGAITSDYVQLNTELATPPTDVGAIYWDDQDKTVTANMEPSNGGGVKLQIGQEMYIRATNKTGTTISNGEVVFISGAQGNRPTIDLADSGSYENATRVIGVATEDIGNNLFGYVTTEGLVRDLNTNDYTDGDCVFVGTVSGSFTTVTPTFGDAKVKVGIITKAHPTDGWLKVCISNDKYMFGAVDDGNYSGFETDGTYVALGDATVYEDLQFSVSGGRVPASNAPTFETFTTNTKEYAFAVNDFIYLDANEPFHAHKINTLSDVHVHATSKTGNSSGSSQYVNVETTLAYVENNGTWNETVLSGECEIPDGTSALCMKIFDLGDFDLTNVGIGGLMKLTVKRISAVSGAEYPDDLFINQIGMHLEVDMLGSREEYVK